MNQLLKKTNVNKRNRILITGGILLIFLNFSLIPQVVAVEDVSFKLSKILGTKISWGNSNSVEGKMEISCSGTDGILSIKQYFNSSLVAGNASNSLNFEFDTSDYGEGEMNITLIGKDSSNQEYSSTQIFKFLRPNLTSDLLILMVPVIVLIPVVVIIVIIIAKKHRMKRNEESFKAK